MGKDELALTVVPPKSKANIQVTMARKFDMNARRKGASLLGFMADREAGAEVAAFLLLMKYRYVVVQEFRNVNGTVLGLGCPDLCSRMVRRGFSTSFSSSRSIETNVALTECYRSHTSTI